MQIIRQNYNSPFIILCKPVGICLNDGFILIHNVVAVLVILLAILSQNSIISNFVFSAAISNASALIIGFEQLLNIICMV